MPEDCLDEAVRLAEAERLELGDLALLEQVVRENGPGCGQCGRRMEAACVKKRRQACCGHCADRGAKVPWVRPGCWALVCGRARREAAMCMRCLRSKLEGLENDGG